MDETALLSGLRHAGIDCSVVLSKADLLDPADRERTRGYIAAELVPVLGPDERVDVRAVSTREGQSAGLDALRAEVLLPLASEHVQRATEALRTRLRRLVALTAASLNGGPPAADAVAIDFEKQRGAAAEAVGKTTDALASSAKRVLEDAAVAVAASWARGEDGAPAARSAIVSAASRGLSAVREAVDRVRSHAGRERKPPRDACRPFSIPSSSMPSRRCHLPGSPPASFAGAGRRVPSSRCYHSSIRRSPATPCAWRRGARAP